MATTITAENGKIAIESLSNAKIDMVITDLNMPMISGMKFLSYMSKNHLEIPVIVLTGYLYFLKGNLIAAATANLKAEEAVPGVCGKKSTCFRNS